MCQKFSCLFHDTIPIISPQGSRNLKGGMCHDFSCRRGIALNALLRTECSIISISNAATKARDSSECGKLQQKHYRAMKEIEDYYGNTYLIDPFVVYWLTNFGALAARTVLRAGSSCVRRSPSRASIGRGQHNSRVGDENGLGTKVLESFFLVLDETAQRMTEWCPSLTSAQSLRWQALVLSNAIGTIVSADFALPT